MSADGMQRLSRVVFVTTDKRSHDLLTRTDFYENIINWVLLTRKDNLSGQFYAFVHKVSFMSLSIFFCYLI